MAAPGREVFRLPPFTAFLDRSDPLRYFNYAVPDGDVEPHATEVERLRKAFRSRDRLPRLEFVEETAPRLAAVLAACGMVEELRSPLMACAPAALVAARPEIDGLVVAPVGDSDLRDASNLQREAFGGLPHDEGERPHDPRARGGGAVLARVSGEPVSAGGWTAVIDGVSEIVGIATAAPWRGRGLAGVVTAAATRDAFAAGASLCILSPGDETAQRVYARAGFTRTATMLHWSDAGAYADERT